MPSGAMFVGREYSVPSIENLPPARRLAYRPISEPPKPGFEKSRDIAMFSQVPWRSGTESRRTLPP